MPHDETLHAAFLEHRERIRFRRGASVEDFYVHTRLALHPEYRLADEYRHLVHIARTHGFLAADCPHGLVSYEHFRDLARLDIRKRRTQLLLYEIKMLTILRAFPFADAENGRKARDERGGNDFSRRFVRLPFRPLLRMTGYHVLGAGILGLQEGGVSSIGTASFSVCTLDCKCNALPLVSCAKLTQKDDRRRHDERHTFCGLRLFASRIKKLLRLTHGRRIHLPVS